MPSVDIQNPQTADNSSDGDGSGNTVPGRAPTPSGLSDSSSRSKPSRSSSSVSCNLPSWMSRWAKPTVASTQLANGMTLRDFKARPLPASSARRRIGRKSSGAAGGEMVAVTAASGTRRPSGTRATAAAGTAGAPAAAALDGDGGGVSSVLLHFMRASSGPCGATATPPASTTQPAATRPPLRTVRTSRSISSDVDGSVGTTRAPALAQNVGSVSFTNATAPAAVPAPAAAATPAPAAAGPQRRPASAGPSQSPSVPPSSPPVSGATCAAATHHLGPSSRPGSNDNNNHLPVQLNGHRNAPLPVGGTASGGTINGGGGGGGSRRPPRPATAAAGANERGGSANGAAGGGAGQLPAVAAAGAGGGGARRRPASASGAASAGVIRRSSNPNSPTKVMVVSATSTARSGSAGRGGQTATAAPSASLRRGPLAAMEALAGLGPLAEDVGYKVAAGDMLLAAGGSGSGSGGRNGGCASPPSLPLNVPSAQHMLLYGSLQDLYERLARPGDRLLHLSLGSVTFSGDLDSTAGGGDAIRIQNRTVILHNCTLAFKPGQKLYVGDGGHVILADVSIIALAGGGGGGGGEAGERTPRGSGARPLPSPRYLNSAASTPRSSRCISSLGLPLLHVSEGGRLLLRGCCVKSVPAGSGGSGGATPPILSILADGGAAVEAIGCRLGRCAAVGDSTWLALRRCTVKPSTADVAAVAAAAAAPWPLLRVADGAAAEVSQVELRNGPSHGVVASGAGTRVALSRSAVVQCRLHGVLVSQGATLTAAICRVGGNGATGMTARGRGTAVDLRDCELSYNTISNLWVGGAANVSLASCSALGSREGCGAAVEGGGTRLLATACIFDGNAASGVRVRQGAMTELRDCSGSGNACSGLEVEGTVDSADNAELLAEATLKRTAPPPPPLPEVFCLVVGGQLAKNSSHGCVVRRGGGLRITAGCELSQNGGDGACADGVGCELLLDGGCTARGNGESGLFVCSGAAVWAEGCRLGGNAHGDVSVGGRGSRGRLVDCVFDDNPMTSLRVHMGAKVLPDAKRGREGKTHTVKENTHGEGKHTAWEQLAWGGAGGSGGGRGLWEKTGLLGAGFRVG
ncbi:hypothetical protein VOLCADRAFT_89708 [Volvox carteri f. nagariensis]|uniref:Right handed beta helix domain-containing protein n=1 Tax=Volvox carteri f. nagariensis TaxID=3068 RepID=D8TRV9_VOLCA|nr:uncharacterized protein VOLCADRAFT_89708 [Volvox carteri f. nagariensis]EFJ49835.1 hypothetical protein VOLCADRAFT_89708 [Volvox carteri f. nagariensis]|eukprot:XP_002949342.1 hypothetical protein VOLCADRAFT_89708 [Volvox carteri f. nagariensis]